MDSPTLPEPASPTRQQVHIKLVLERRVDGAVDIDVDVPRDAFIFDVKAAVFAQHPLHPPPAVQKLIFAGRLLSDSDRLDSVLDRVRAG